MSARVTAFLVWGVVAAAAMFWGLRLSARAPQAPAHALVVADAVPAAGDYSRLLGRAPAGAASAPAAPAAPELAARFRLLGVMAPRGDASTGAGVALLAIDGKPARAFRPGATVDGQLVLQSVGLRTAAIGPAAGAAVLTLEVPRLPAASTATALPSAPPPPPPVLPRAQPQPQVQPAPPPQFQQPQFQQQQPPQFQPVPPQPGAEPMPVLPSPQPPPLGSARDRGPQTQ